MGKRGKKSAAALAVVTEDSKIDAASRPGPPEELTEEQAVEWLIVTNSLPPEWFPPCTLQLLIAYCKHVVANRRVGKLIAQVEAGKVIDVDEYDRLLKMQVRETRQISSLATRMRLTQQSTIDRERKKPVLTKNPWED